MYSRYNAVSGVQAMVLRYKREHDISGNCHEPKSGSIFREIVIDNGVFACLAANSVCKQRIWYLSKFDIALQNATYYFQINTVCA